MAINRDFFFERVSLTLFDGKLAAKPKAGLTAILDGWEKWLPKVDDRWIAYAFATAHHETDRTIGPIREYGRGKGRKYGLPDPATGQTYYGRGLVQLTWKDNYAKCAKLLKVDLVNQPDLALDLANAVPIMLLGMRDGLFTGRKFADYFSPTVEKWVDARAMINGRDRAQLIADYAKRYYAAMSYK